jgi:hypothetical protein
MENLMIQLRDRVLPYITLDKDWNNMVLSAFKQGTNFSLNDDDQSKIDQALKNLRKHNIGIARLS